MQLIAIVVCEHLRLHEQVHVIRPEIVEPAQLPGLDETEHLEHGQALGRRRRLVDRDAAIGRVERLPPLGALRGKVALVEEAAVDPGVARHLGRGLALVEAGAAAGADALEGPREVGIAEPVTGRERPTLRQEEARGVGIGGERVHGHGRPVGEPRRHREPIAGVLDRRGEIEAERQAAVVGVRPAPAVHRAGHGERRGQDPLQRNLREPPRPKPLDVGAARGAPAAFRKRTARIPVAHRGSARTRRHPRWSCAGTRR